MGVSHLERCYSLRSPFGAHATTCVTPRSSVPTAGLALGGAAEFLAQKSPAVSSRAFLYLDWSGREDSHTTYKQLKLNNYPQYHQPIYPHKYPQFAPAGPLIGAIPSIWRRLISAGPIISRAARRAIWPAHPCRTSLYDTSYSASLHPIGSAGRHFSIYQQGAS